MVTKETMRNHCPKSTCKVHLGIFKKKEKLSPPYPPKNIILFI